MKAYIINMPEAKSRRNHMESLFLNLNITPEYIEAVIGKNLKLPHPDFNEFCYRLAHGKRPNLSELGCYFSHLKAMEGFLKTCESHALILEDDLNIDPSIEKLINESLKYKNYFDLLILTGIHHGHPVNVFSLNEKFSLACNLTQLNGSGAYLLNRRAAKQILKKLKPMWLPFDHAFGREWAFGVKTLTVNPLPIKQNITDETQIDANSNYKLQNIKRITVFLFRLYNEISRVTYRSLRIIKLKIINKLIK